MFFANDEEEVREKIIRKNATSGLAIGDLVNGAIVLHRFQVGSDRV